MGRAIIRLILCSLILALVILICSLKTKSNDVSFFQIKKNLVTDFNFRTGLTKKIVNICQMGVSSSCVSTRNSFAALFGLQMIVL